MSDSNDEMNHAVLNLTPEEKRTYAFLFNQADTDQLGVITGERAVAFFERTNVSPAALGEMWQIADTDNRGFLSKPGFCMVLRLIGHYQAGRDLTPDLAFKPAPIPKFNGLQVPAAPTVAPPAPPPPSAQLSPSQASFPAGALQPQNSGQAGIRIPPLDPQKVQQYSSLFERSGAQNGYLDGLAAKAIFERAGLPNETLGRIWNLADREQRGALGQTEFIVAMHLLTSMKTRAMTALPNTLPQGFYDAAARRGAPPPPAARQAAGPIPRQFTSGSVAAPGRTQSPLARPPGYGTPPPVAAHTTDAAWLVSNAEKAKYDQFFAGIDKQGRGIITGEQAVSFFSDSNLPEDTLASIWDLADINSEGHLTKDEFAVAMYLIRQQRASNAAPLPAFLPPPLIPPSMRKPNLQQQTQQTTAPAFDNSNNTSNLPKSAAEDLFGLDEPVPASSQPALTAAQPQSTGGTAPRDPFNSSVPASPSSPARFQPQPQQPSSLFKPFMPTSAFGASLAQQHTGGSQGSAPGQSRALPQQQQQQQQQQKPQIGALDDLLGDNETHAEESSKLTNESSELANMSNQIGNLRTQMEQTQAKKSATQGDFNATSLQKKDLETRLQQFRAQYEQEVRAVKDLEQQLTTSRESTKKLGQELALLEGTHQDLQTQHQSIAQALQADQSENTGLKQRIAQLNAEVARLKPEIEKLKLDARQQKGMASINKKQLATNEAERDRLQTEKTTLEREAAEAAERSVSPPFVESDPVHNTRDVGSPAGSTLSSTNPFFRKPNQDTATPERSASPAFATSSTPTPSAFDQLFGPSSFANSKSPPPATSFGSRQATAIPAVMTDSMSSDGRPTPSATPPLSDVAKDNPQIIEPPPPPPESRQFTPAQLPVGGLKDRSDQDDVDSTKVFPPASDVGDASSTRGPNPSDFFGTSVGGSETLPGAFPEGGETPTVPPQESSLASPRDDFDSAFASFGAAEKSTEAEGREDPFAPSEQLSSSQGRPFDSEFPPIHSLEHDEGDSDSDSEAERGFGDSFASTAPPATSHVPTAVEEPEPESEPSNNRLTALRPYAVTANSNASSFLPPITAQTSPPSYEQSEKTVNGDARDRSGSLSNPFPKEFTGLLPSREDPTSSSPPPAAAATATAAAHQQEPEKLKTVHPADPAALSSNQTPTSTAGTAPNSDVFHDAYSRPLSSVTDGGAGPSLTSSAPTTAPKNAFDDFDDFDDLSEAKDADKSGTDFDFGFADHSRENSEFNPAFDSPAASMTNTVGSSQTLTNKNSAFGHGDTNGFASFTLSASTNSAFGQGTVTGNSSLQQTPQGAQHDWDAIFSGLDSSSGSKLDTSFGSSDPWAPTNGVENKAAPEGETSHLAASSQAGKARDIGRAITPGTEHDDPILKRLTGMGYARADALSTLEKYDYDINRAIDHLTSGK